MVLVAFLAHVFEELLEIRNLTDRDTAIHIAGIIGKIAFSHIRSKRAVAIIGIHPKIGHRACRYLAFDRAEAVFAPQTLAQNIKFGDLDISAHKTFGIVTAMGIDAFVTIVAVIIVPIEKSGNLP